MKNLALTLLAPAIAGVFSGLLLASTTTIYWSYQLLLVVATVLTTPQIGARRALGMATLNGAVFGVAVLAARATTGWADVVDMGEQPGFYPILTAICGAILGSIGGTVTKVRHRRTLAASAG